MVDNNEASPEDIDKALINSPAARMAFKVNVWPSMLLWRRRHGNDLDQFGPALNYHGLIKSSKVDKRTKK